MNKTKSKINKIEKAFKDFVNISLVTDDKIIVKTGNMQLMAICRQKDNFLEIISYSKGKAFWLYIFDLDTQNEIISKEIKTKFDEHFVKDVYMDY